jgi:hypothetical protein
VKTNCLVILACDVGLLLGGDGRRSVFHVRRLGLLHPGPRVFPVRERGLRVHAPNRMGADHFVGHHRRLHHQVQHPAAAAAAPRVFAAQPTDLLRFSHPRSRAALHPGHAQAARVHELSQTGNFVVRNRANLLVTMRMKIFSSGWQLETSQCHLFSHSSCTCSLRHPLEESKRCCLKKVMKPPVK